LPKDDHGTCENVRAFDGDRNRNLLVGAAQVIVRPHANTFAAVYIHGVVDDLPRTLGQMVFRNCRITDGFSPRSTAPAVMVRTASIK
jgi:hypothetical protein